MLFAPFSFFFGGGKDFDRVFLNLWFAKSMVCVRVAFHENDVNHENAENDKETRTAKNKELSAGFAEITETTNPEGPEIQKISFSLERMKKPFPHTQNFHSRSKYSFLL